MLAAEAPNLFYAFVLQGLVLAVSGGVGAVIYVALGRLPKR